MNKRSWVGRVAIRPGIGVFEGQSGDNQEHIHWAHQLNAGLDGAIEVISNGRCHRASTLFIRAGTPHRLIGSAVLFVFLDPASSVSRSLCAHIDSDSPILEPPEDVIKLLRNSFSASGPVEDGIEKFRNALQIRKSAEASDKLQSVLAMLAQNLGNTSETGRKSLATLTGLSESRFSHWFREHTGMPLRSYRKWLRLIYGVEQMLKGQTLTQIAHEAQFSDQAHFTRTFVQMFGVRPSDLLLSSRKPI